MIKCLGNIQGTKTSAHNWYNLLSGVFHTLGMTHSSSDDGVFKCKYTGDGI